MVNPDNDGFLLVKSRKKGHRKFNQCVLTRNFINSKTCAEVSEEEILRKLDKARSNIISTECFKTTFETINAIIQRGNLERIEKLVCFGVGSFSTCSVAMQQLAYILEIRDDLNIPHSEFYDPIFNDCERTVLRKVGCDLMSENIEGKYPIRIATLLFLPHCNNQMTNNFLWKNWEKSLLQKSILICNSFETLRMQNPDRFNRINADYVLRICDHTVELPLQAYSQYEDVFNDTSIHAFFDEKLPSADSKFWEKGAQPIYDDPELITGDFTKKLRISNKREKS